MSCIVSSVGMITEFDNALSFTFILSLFYAGLTIHIQHLLHYLRIYYLLFRNVSASVLDHLQGAREDGQKNFREDDQEQLVKLATRGRDTFN